MSQHRSWSNPRNSPAAGPGAAPWSVVLQPTPALPYVHAGDAPVMLPVGNTHHSSPSGMPIPSYHAGRGTTYDGGLMIPSSSAYPSSLSSSSTPVPIPRSSPARVNSGGHFEDRYVDPAYYGSQLAPSPGEIMAANIAAARMSGMTSQMLQVSAHTAHPSDSSAASSRSTSTNSTRTASTLTSPASSGTSSGRASKKFYICNDDASPSCASSYA